MDCAKKKSQFDCDPLISEKSLALTVLAATLVAFLPVLSWLWQRTFDASDEPWGLVALITIAVYGICRREKLPGWTSALLSNSRIPAILMVAFAVSQFFCPMLVRAALCMSIVACFMAAAAGSGSKMRLSHFALLILSLPLLPSLQFFFGYPLRVAVAHTVAVLVGVSGVTVDGTGLLYHGSLVAIDAPCAGLRMLWTSVYLALAVSCFKGYSNRQTVLISMIAVAASYVGNVMRAGSLVYGFYLASLAPAQLVVQNHGFKEFPYFHDVIGVCSFLIVIGVVLIFAARIKAPSSPMEPVISEKTEPRFVRLPALPGHRQVLLYLLAVCLAVVISCMNVFVQELSVANADEFNGWPKTFEGQVIYPLSMSDWELKFAQNFPGRIAKFSDGNDQILMRWIKHETRQLHSLKDCLRGAGYAVSEQGLALRSGGERWASFAAAKPGSVLAVRERITDSKGGSWTDVSEWYWAALTGKTRGPWLSVSVIEETQ